MLRAPKTYGTIEEAIGTVHPVQPQPGDNGWLVDHVARQSLRRTDAGWTWRSDPRIFTARRPLPEVVTDPA